MQSPLVIRRRLAQTPRSLALATMVVCFVSPPTRAQDGEESDSVPLGFHGIGGQFSIVSVSAEGLGTTFGLGLHVDAGDLTRGLALFPRISYWRQTVGDLVYSEVGLDAELRHYFYFPEGYQSLAFYGGGGLGFVRRRVSWKYFDSSYSWPDAGSDTTLNLVIGGEADVSSRTSGFVEFRYALGLSQWDTYWLTVGFTVGMDG